MSVTDNNIKMAKIVAPAIVVGLLGFFIILTVSALISDMIEVHKEVGRIVACGEWDEPTECLSVDR